MSFARDYKTLPADSLDETIEEHKYIYLEILDEVIKLGERFFRYCFSQSNALIFLTLHG